MNLVIVGNMSEPHDIPHDLPGSQALNRAQAATLLQQSALLATQGRMIEELGSEMAKLRSCSASSSTAIAARSES